MGRTPATETGATTRTYGFKWDQPVVYVYDGTPATSGWKVAEAVSEWSRPTDNLNLKMTDDLSIADIVFMEEETPGVYSGYSRWTVDSANTATDARISLSPWWANDPQSEHIAIHELGHCLGLDHNSGYIKGSVMNAAGGTIDTLSTPGRMDIKSLETIY